MSTPYNQRHNDSRLYGSLVTAPKPILAQIYENPKAQMRQYDNVVSMEAGRKGRFSQGR